MLHKDTAGQVFPRTQRGEMTNNCLRHSARERGRIQPSTTDQRQEKGKCYFEGRMILYNIVDLLIYVLNPVRVSLIDR